MAEQTIQCPKCKTEIPLTDAISNKAPYQDQQVQSAQNAPQTDNATSMDEEFEKSEESEES